MRYRLKLDGMSCGHCKTAAHQALETVPGLETKEVQIGEATISSDDLDSVKAALYLALEEEGFPILSIEKIS